MAASANKSGRRKIESPTEYIDSGIFAAIYDNTHLPIYRYIYRQVNDVDVARDLTADVFHRLLQAVHKGAGPDNSVKAWLYRTAHNIVIDYYRRQEFRSHVRLERNLVSNTALPEETAADQIMTEAARQALKTLTPDQRQVICLKVLDGMSNKEVAEIMGKSIGAVKSLQHRALAALQRSLSPLEKSQPAAM